MAAAGFSGGGGSTASENQDQISSEGAEIVELKAKIEKLEKEIVGLNTILTSCPEGERVAIRHQIAAKENRILFKEQELTRLLGQAAGGVPRGVQHVEGDYYSLDEPKHATPKVAFKLVNTGTKAETDAEKVLVDTGAKGGLTIPARKALELGLSRMASPGAVRHFRGAGNDSFSKVMMTPQLELELQITIGEKKESRFVVVNAWCHEQELSNLQSHPSVTSSAATGCVLAEAGSTVPPFTSSNSSVPSTLLGRGQASTVSSSSSRSSGADSKSAAGASAVTDSPLSPSSPPCKRLTIPLKKNSPIQHRPPKHPNERATIGVEILYELGAGINFFGDVPVFEVAEETPVYDE